MVAAVLLAAIVAPNLLERRVAGQSTAKEIAQPPAAGDCVTGMADPWRLLDEPAFSDVGLVDYPTAVTGSCDGLVVGEVVSVALSATPPVLIGVTEYLTEMSPCPIDAIGYTGSIAPVVQRPGGQPAIVWSPRLNFQYTTVGPDRVQRAAGQHWSACVIGAVDGLAYRGRLRDVLRVGAPPPEFGTCLSSPGPVDRTQVPCGRPHQVEILGSTEPGPLPIARADLQQACQVFAGRAMRTADPTRDGAVGLRAVGATDPLVATTGDTPPDPFILCIAEAQGGALFDGTLVGVADGPLPLS